MRAAARRAIAALTRMNDAAAAALLAVPLSVIEPAPSSMGGAGDSLRGGGCGGKRALSADAPSAREDAGVAAMAHHDGCGAAAAPASALGARALASPAAEDAYAVAEAEAARAEVELYREAAAESSLAQSPDDGAAGAGHEAAPYAGMVDVCGVQLEAKGAPASPSLIVLTPTTARNLWDLAITMTQVRGAPRRRRARVLMQRACVAAEAGGDVGGAERVGEVGARARARAADWQRRHD